jgi:hypothetical protein
MMQSSYAISRIAGKNLPATCSSFTISSCNAYEISKGRPVPGRGSSCESPPDTQSTNQLEVVVILRHMFMNFIVQFSEKVVAVLRPSIVQIGILKLTAIADAFVI